jgi:hypothetical protein
MSQQQRPASVMGAIWLLVALVALTGLTALLSVVFEDDLIGAWAASASTSSSVEPPSFVPVALTLFIVLALLAGVLVMFFREGLNWSRLALTALIVLMGISDLAGLRVHPPTLFWVLSIAALVLDVAVLAFLWHKDTRTFCAIRPAEADHRS